MKRIILILVVLTALSAALGSAYRLWRILPYPVGTGESKKSPDERFEASVTDYYDETFLGYSRRWYKFEVRGRGKVWGWTGDPVPGAVFGSRTPGTVIHWSPDSASVRFVFPGVEVVVTPP
jgi:hypothetical protein